MIDGNVVAETVRHSLDHLRGQGYFRNQDQNLPVFTALLSRQLHVYLSLSRTGKAVQQDHSLVAGVYPVNCLFLLFGKRIICFSDVQFLIFRFPFPAVYLNYSSAEKSRNVIRYQLVELRSGHFAL